MYDTIVAPNDGSEPAKIATEAAIELASRFDADLSILTVLEAPDLPMSGSLPSNPGREHLDERRRQALQRAESSAANADVTSQTRIVSGTPYEEIEAHVAATGADIVAMGTHGRSGVERLLLGSVTERVIRSVDTPVLTLGSPVDDGEFEDILVPTDGSDGSERAAEHACTIAEQYGASVHALGVVDTRSISAAAGAGAAIPDLVQSLEQRRERDTDEIREWASERGIDCEAAVIKGAPGQDIRAYASEHDIDLVTMGTHGREGARRLFLGSVTERTIRSTDLPVLATPLPD